MKAWIIALVGRRHPARRRHRVRIELAVEGRAGLLQRPRYFAGSLTNLTSLTPANATQGEFQAALGAVQSSWGNVKISAQHLTT